MDLLIDIATIILLSAGLFFFFAGTVGLLRFPDLFCRLHALTKVDNLGLGCITLGVIIQMGSFLHSIQLLLIWFFMMLSGVLSGLLIANHAIDRAKKPALVESSNEH